MRLSTSSLWVELTFGIEWVCIQAPLRYWMGVPISHLWYWMGAPTSSNSELGSPLVVNVRAYKLTFGNGWVCTRYPLWYWMECLHAPPWYGTGVRTTPILVLDWIA